MIIGIGRVEFFLPENRSLKEKRQKIRRIVERTKHKFNVSIAEVDRNNLWQKARIGFSVVGQRKEEIEKVLEEIENFMESFYFGNVISSEREIIVVGNEI